MTGTIEREALGDWNNIRGTEYHFVYALWMLIAGDARELFFYRGNDLLAAPATPPAPDNIDPGGAPIPARAEEEGRDVWIQLKASPDPWTVTALLGENLLLNFIFNALTSERRGRPWEARLVSQGEVRADAIDEFLSGDGAETRGNRRRLDEIVAEVVRRCAEGDSGFEPVTQEHVRELAEAALRQIATNCPLPIRVLKAEIERNLAFAYPDRETVRRLCNTLLGALLDATAPGPERPTIFDAQWLDRAAGRPLRPSGLFDVDPPRAFDRFAREAAPRAWDVSQAARRARLFETLGEFLQAEASVFTVVGPTGSGRSWALATWVNVDLAGQARILLSADDVESGEALEELVARRMARHTTAEGPPSVLFRRVLASAAGSETGRLVIVVDDIRVPHGGVPALRSQLGRLARDVDECNAKLVLGCSSELWDGLRPGDSIPADRVFAPASRSDRLELGHAEFDAPEAYSLFGQSIGAEPVSFVLDDFTVGEFSDAIERRLGPERAAVAARALAAEAFAPLRRPQYLGRYLDRHGDTLGLPDRTPAPANVDALLDERVVSALDRVHRDLEHGYAALEAAFRSLITALWEHRPEGLAYEAALDALRPALGEEARLAFRALRDVGVLAHSESVRFAELAVGDRLFARRAIEGAGALDDVAAALRPATDAGVAAALMRGGDTDPVALAELLLDRDGRWLGVVCRGLSESQHVDERLVALLVTLTRPTDDRYAEAQACEALGRLAARDRRARARLAGMWLGKDALDRYRAKFAIVTMMAIEPGAACRLVELRLRRASRMWGRSRDERVAYLSGAFDPLERVSVDASGAASRLVSRYGELVDNTYPRDRALRRSLARVRASLERLGGRNALEGLGGLLASPDVDERKDATRAARAIVFDTDELDALLLDRIRVEEDTGVLYELLGLAYALVRRHPDVLLGELERRYPVGWATAGAAGGPSLFILGTLAEYSATRVAAILPGMNFLLEGPGAVHAEMLAFAWWRCAEREARFAPVLRDLATVDGNAAAEGYRTFVHRGAAVSRLALACLGRASISDLGDVQVYYRGSHTYLNTTDFCARVASLVRAHADYALLEQRLIASVSSPAGNSRQLTCVTLGLEMLARFAAVEEDSTRILALLPHEWEAQRAVRRLLQLRSDDARAMAFAVEACRRPEGGDSAIAIRERQRCLEVIARLPAAPAEAIESLSETITDPHAAFIHVEPRPVQAFAAITDTRRDDLFPFLDELLGNAYYLPIIRKWQFQTRTWRGLLLSRVYARTFDERRISMREAIELCGWVLSAVHGAPQQGGWREHELVYERIHNALSGTDNPGGAGVAATGPIGRSHLYALEVLNEAPGGAADVEHWLTGKVADPRAHLEHDFARLDLDTELDAEEEIYYMPAVRLALVAIGARYDIQDPAARYLRERRGAYRVLYETDHVFIAENATTHEEYLEALGELSEQLEQTPNDERLWLVRGRVRIGLRQLVEASADLERCRELSAGRQRMQAAVMLDHARVYAINEDERACRQAMEASIRLHPVEAGYLNDVAELERYRDTAWFQALSPTVPGQIAAAGDENDAA